jgi:hypothetical protein
MMNKYVRRILHGELHDSFAKKEDKLVKFLDILEHKDLLSIYKKTEIYRRKKREKMIKTIAAEFSKKHILNDDIVYQHATDLVHKKQKKDHSNLLARVLQNRPKVNISVDVQGETAILRGEVRHHKIYYPDGSIRFGVKIESGQENLKLLPADIVKYLETYCLDLDMDSTNKTEVKYITSLCFFTATCLLPEELQVTLAKLVE